MSKSDEARPEPVLFLELAAEAMKDYHAKHGQYPAEWHLLDFTFANGPYRVDDPDVRPTKKMGNRWKPKDCKFTYEIAEADKERYQINALNSEGEAAYLIEPGMTTPRKLLKTEGDDLCTIEQPQGKEIPEPAHFLNAAAARFAEYHKAHGTYPTAWDQLDFHWALIRHKATDAKVRPPAGCGKSWTPLGGKFTYLIVKADKETYEIRSTNTHGLLNYRLTPSDTSPVIEPRPQ